MKFDILTIFPEYFDSPFSIGLFKKAREKGVLEISTRDIRDYTEDKHRTVDDSPYGGGGGMLMKPGPIGAAVEDARKGGGKSVVILTTPAGKPFTDKDARELASEYDRLIIICGRYEGIDDRVREIYVDREVSVGDYVLSGGEPAAAVIIDSVSRFLPGFHGNEQSAEADSFNGGLLEYPQYTRPESFQDKGIPEVLMSGNHGQIDEWRRKESLKRTYLARPDLLDRAKVSLEDINHINTLKEENPPFFRAYIALIHYPVYNNRLTIINTAFTNLDVHDIARAATTYGIQKYYLVQPNAEQKQLIGRVLRHWNGGDSGSSNRSRSEALEIVEVRDTLAEAIEDIERIEGRKPAVVVTDARPRDNMIGYGELREKMFQRDSGPYLILFGTGWGLAEEILAGADYTLKPVSGYTAYNHLSVRSAAAVILDRLFSCTI